jgi:hypothetical protein
MMLLIGFFVKELIGSQHAFIHSQPTEAVDDVCPWISDYIADCDSIGRE